MGDHVLLENEDDAPQDFSNTNPFAPRPASPEEGDWKAKLGAFARKAGDTVKQHAAKAAASAQVKLAEAKGMCIRRCGNDWARVGFKRRTSEFVFWEPVLASDVAHVALPSIVLTPNHVVLLSHLLSEQLN